MLVKDNVAVKAEAHALLVKEIELQDGGSNRKHNKVRYYIDTEENVSGKVKITKLL